MYNANRSGIQKGNPSTHVSASPFERVIGDLRQKRILLGALLVLATLLLYGPVTRPPEVLLRQRSAARPALFFAA